MPASVHDLLTPLSWKDPINIQPTKLSSTARRCNEAIVGRAELRQDLSPCKFHLHIARKLTRSFDTPSLVPDSMQMCNGLIRYHSAPSSVLAGLIDEDILSRDSNALTEVEDLEFARFLDDNLCSMANPHFGSKPLPSPSFTTEEARACLTGNEIRPQLHIEHKTSAIQRLPCMANGCSKSIKDVFRGPLSLISELRANESNKFCSAFQLNAQMKMGEASCSNLQKPPSALISNEADVRSHLTRNNSSPADVLSRLIMEKGNGETVLHFGGHFTQELGKGSIVNHVSATSLLPTQSISTFDEVNYASKREDGKGVEAKSVKSPADERNSSLLRQNSSPAGLLSQISFGGMSSSTCTNLSSSPLLENSSEEERRVGAYRAARFLDEMGSDKAGLLHRKRGREGHGMRRLQSSESSFTNLHAPHVGDGPVSMEVLCKVSAKRGCATHPRSIAERVRRNKINEGMRKLQELMPNMEKQTNTVAMLDEAVEYVKSLQRQVQELSESGPKCDGRCHLKENA